MSTASETTREAVMALPDKLPELVEFLVAGGYTGVPNWSCRCPISRYFTANSPCNNWTTSGVDVFKKWGEEGFAYMLNTYGEPLPPAVQEFIPLFDAGEYPALIEEYTYRWAT